MSLTAACFTNFNGTGAAVYDLQRGKKCLANLIASGYKKFTIDVYWTGVDGFERGWGLCPMATRSSVPTNNAHVSNDSSTASSDGGGDTDTRSTGPSASPSLSARLATRASSPPVTDNNYKCSSNLGIDDVLRVFSDYFQQSEDTLHAKLLYAVVNMRSAKLPSSSESSSPTSSSSSSSPTPSDQPDNLPSQKELLGPIFHSQVGQYMYTSDMLKSDRANLNRSWFAHLLPPIAEYMATSPEGSEASRMRTPVSTKDGWPCEVYVVYQLAKRFLVAWGDIDEDMEGYDFDGDTGILFQPKSLSNEKNTTIAGDNRSHSGGGSGKITSGCLFNQSSTAVDTSNEQSWTESTKVAAGSNLNNKNSNSTFSPSLVSHLVDCGLSPSIIHPISNTSADRDPSTYLTFIKDATWSWAPGEPVNSDPVLKSDDARCATLDVKSGTSGSIGSGAGNNNKHNEKKTEEDGDGDGDNDDDDEDSGNSIHNKQNEAQKAGNKNIYHANGRWRASDCSRRLFGACRVGNEPFKWTISAKQSRYADVQQHCPKGTSFAVPRTALENRYLHAFLKNEAAKDKNNNYDGNDPVWLDLNSLQVDHCWVSGGADAKCTYSVRTTADSNRRNVIVPTVAVIIVLAITAATLLVKCHENSRRQRRNRVIKGWEYEGVPS